MHGANMKITGSKLLINVDYYLPTDKTLCPRHLALLSTPLLEPKITQVHFNVANVTKPTTDRQIHSLK